MTTDTLLRIILVILSSALAFLWVAVAADQWLQGDLWMALLSACMAALMAVAVIVEVRKR